MKEKTNKQNLREMPVNAGVQCEAGEGRVGARNEEATLGLACVADSLNYRFRTKPVVFERLRPAAPQANPGSTVKKSLTATFESFHFN